MGKRIGEKRLLLVSYFWRYGIIGVAFVLPIIFGIIFYNVERLHIYTPHVVFFSCGIPLCAMGLDYILGCIFEWKHMILINQSCHHLKMNTYNLKWDVNKKEFIGVGITFLILGIVMIIVPFLIKLI